MLKTVIQVLRAPKQMLVGIIRISPSELLSLWTFMFLLCIPEVCVFLLAVFTALSCLATQLDYPVPPALLIANFTKQCSKAAKTQPNSAEGFTVSFQLRLKMMLFSCKPE